MSFRREKDSLGELKVPMNAYYGIQTCRALKNFPVSGIKANPHFIKAYILIKKAAAFTNIQGKVLDKKIGEAIIEACNEILSDKYLDQFVVDVFQAGAGTSFNMNVNEVISNIALENMGKSKGDYDSINPNDHVNLGQSSNDTFPTALNLSILFRMPEFISVMDKTVEAFEAKGNEFMDIIKAGRTHLEDAVPITLGQEFKAYGKAISRSAENIQDRASDLSELPIGGTALGTGINTYTGFRDNIMKTLRDLTGLDLKSADDPREQVQSRQTAAAFSSGLKELAQELVRIANDLRLLNSGPATGLAEIELPAVQPGSSIMPGKVNPVMAECLNMIGYQVISQDLAISLATQAGQLDLNVMTPVISYNLHSSLDLLVNFLPAFTEFCLKGIKANKERCHEYFEKTTALATILNPHIGYLKAAEIVKESIQTGKSIKDIVLEKKLLDREVLDKLFDPKNLTGLLDK